ncbi:MAG: hypothetical protein CVT68_04650 [Actinobacteria bacterium HGW-Actinobacteria-8]|nr:MAG: hypothetical protein CVT68_04650 [Actinobacteria bacterium HGW-Actinobacteria-8]
MFKINLKALLARGSDEGFYAPGAEFTKRGQHREIADAIVEVSEVDRTPKRKEPPPVPGFGASANWGVW